MGLEFQDLKPVEATIVVDNNEFTLRPFDLTAQAWALNFFATEENTNGMAILTQRLANNNDIEAILKVAWYLLKSKPHFGTYEKFVKKIDKEDHKWTRVMEIQKAIVYTMGVSQPKLEEFEEEIELKKLSAAGM